MRIFFLELFRYRFQQSQLYADKTNENQYYPLKVQIKASSERKVVVSLRLLLIAWIKISAPRLQSSKASFSSDVFITEVGWKKLMNLQSSNLISIPKTQARTRHNCLTISLMWYQTTRNDKETIGNPKKDYRTVCVPYEMRSYIFLFLECKSSPTL